MSNTWVKVLKASDPELWSSKSLNFRSVAGRLTKNLPLRHTITAMDILTPYIKNQRKRFCTIAFSSFTPPPPKQKHKLYRSLSPGNGIIVNLPHRHVYILKCSLLSARLHIEKVSAFFFNLQFNLHASAIRMVYNGPFAECYFHNQSQF